MKQPVTRKRYFKVPAEYQEFLEAEIMKVSYLKLTGTRIKKDKKRNT